VSGLGVCFRGGRRWPLAILATAGTFVLSQQTEAAIYYWQDSGTVVTEPAPKAKARHTKASRRGEKKSELVEKDAKPQGPLIISISIAQQKLRIYDARGLFAESPISTGMPGHPTPMGVFSVIQKQKFHRSNIYSGAPMPFMQRITWSGVAMHAGVLPGHPASHGCIRMPMAFAVKMYGWTKMGARVVVTPGDVTPASFSHPLLATIKVVPQPVAVEETKADVAPVKTAEKLVQIEASTVPAPIETKIELRSTVGHVGEAKSEESPPSTATKTADASGALPTSLTTNATAAREPDAAISQADPNATKRDETTASDEKSISEKSDEAQPEKIAAKPAEPPNDQAAKPETAPAAQEATKASDTATATATSATEAPKSNIAAEAAVQKDAAKATAAVPPEAAPAAQATPPAAAPETSLKADLKGKPDPGFAFQGTGQIAVFVSRKDSKLYIRQNFAPLFQTPVTIATDVRPLGTHIFTAQVDGNDRNALHWSVVSLPVPAKAERRAEVERLARGRKFANAVPIEAKPLPMPDSPAEALDRLSLPSEVMAKIYEALSTGGSIIVSDQGIAAGETGEGTDFIVSLR